MKKTFVKGLFATLAALFLTTGAHADSYNSCSPCEPECCDPCAWGLDFGADFIYWKVCSDENKFAVTDTVNQDGSHNYHHHGVEHDWIPGFRVRVGKKDVMCCWDIGAQYTRLSDSQSARASGLVYSLDFENVWDAVAAKREFTYNNLDILFGKEIAFSECHRFKPFFGVDMLWLDQNLKSAFEEQEDEVTYLSRHKWSSDLSAYGLKAGSAYTLSLGCGFELYGIASGSILYGDADVHHRFAIGERVNDVEDLQLDVSYKDSRCGCIFGWQVAAGVDYKVDLCDMPLVFNLGYQFIQWYNVPGSNHYSDVDGNPGLSSGRNSAFGLHGLVLGVDASF